MTAQRQELWAIDDVRVATVYCPVVVLTLFITAVMRGTSGTQTSSDGCAALSNALTACLVEGG